MDKEQLELHIKDWFHNFVLPAATDIQAAVQTYEELLSLIESSGAEVGDEEREGLLHHFDTAGVGPISHAQKYQCPLCDQIRALLRQPRRTVSRECPKIVCLCGSTRFTSEMLIKQWELTKQGHIVLSWCALPDYYFAGEDKAHIGDQEGVKEIVDEVHKRKIDLADEVFVLNIGGYIGESTRSEIEYAKTHGKNINYLEPLAELGFAVEEPKGGGKKP